MSGDRKENPIVRPLAACAMSVACALATVLVSADAHAQSHRLEIVAEAAPDAATNRRFILISMSPEGAAEDPLREQALVYIRRGLTVADFVAVEGPEEAEIAIAFSFGIGSSDFRPMRGPPITRAPSTGLSMTPVIVAVPDVSGVVVINEASPQAQQLPRATPLTNDLSQRLSGGVPVFLELVAFDLQAFQEANQPIRLWRTVVYALAPNIEVDLLLSVMLAGGEEYFGAQYDEMRYATVSESSRVARFIRGETQRSGRWVNERRPGNPSSRR